METGEKVTSTMSKTKIIIIVAVVAGVSILALVLGLVLGLRKKDKEDDLILNSYDNTDELIKKFPVNNPTTVLDGIEKKIQNRLLTGFENWNRGFKAWKAWGDILYTNYSIYNVHGARLTLSQYQAAMDVSLKQTNIIMGAFYNMIINENFTGIHYDFTTVVDGTEIPGKVMEFVLFKDYGDDLGTRVVEGWGSTKDESGDRMAAAFQGDEEKAVQQQQTNYMLNYEIPDEADLKKKYPIRYPSNYIDDNANEILEIILEGFDKWNLGITDYYIPWVDNKYSSTATSSGLNDKERTLTKYKEEITQLTNEQTIKKLYFENILIRDNWAAIHYRYRIEKQSGEKTVGDRMQFLKFENINGSLKIVASWIQ